MLGGAIDKYCYITCRYLPPFFSHRYRIVYSLIETVRELEEIKHPSVRETLKYISSRYGDFWNDMGLEIHHDGDIPARSGMGSSSAFTVGLLNTLYAMLGKLAPKDGLYKEAIHIEQQLIKENVGSQDQVWAAAGGINRIEFMQNGEIVVNPIVISESRLRMFESKLMLFYTGVSRIAHEVAGDKIRNLASRAAELDRMSELVDEAAAVLTSDRSDLSTFGELLNETWQLKRRLSTKVSNDSIDELYARAIKAGATGGKLLGAGGGGFILFFVEPERHKSVKDALREYLHVPFKFNFTGSEIMIYHPEHLWR